MEHKGPLAMNPASAKSPLVKDPVCGMTVDPATARHKAGHAGATYYFCSAGCREKFLAEPERFLAQASAHAGCAHAAHEGHDHGAHGHVSSAPAGRAPSKPAPKGAIYTCPMHPEIRQDHPGNCPICGMALEPEIAAEAKARAPSLPT